MLGLAEIIPTNTQLKIKSKDAINATNIPNCKIKEENGMHTLESESQELPNKLEINNENGSIDVGIKSWIDSLNLKDVKNHQQVEFGLMWNFY